MSASFGEESLQEEREEEQQLSQQSPHPAGNRARSPISASVRVSFAGQRCTFAFLFSGIVLNRVGYYTIPSMDELADMVDENGECIVENFTIGRRGTACTRVMSSFSR